jgi:hypothetical protein
LINTEKGEYLFDQVRKELKTFETSLSDIKEGNTVIDHNLPQSPLRNIYFEKRKNAGVIMSAKDILGRNYEE